MNQTNRILFERRRSILPDASRGDIINSESLALCATASRNLEDLGMYMSADLMKEIAKQKPESARETLSSLIEMAKKEVGADHEYRPMYPGFPEQVMNMEDARFFYNALIYYMTGFPPYESIMYEDDDLIAERDMIEYACENLKCVNLADVGDIEKIYENLVTAPQILSEKDVETVMQIVTETPEILRKDVDIRNKETLCLLASKSADELHVPIRDNAFLRMLRTPTDVARFIAVRSGNDASLTDAKFENKPGKERKLYAELFNRCNGNEEDIRKREGLFKMLFRKYHLPSLVDDRMKKVADDLYHGSYSEKTFESQREALKEAGNTDGLLRLYERRPGMLAADMTGLIRYGENIPGFEDRLTEVFREKAPEISANALMNLYRAVNYYEKERDHAIYMPKKGQAKPYVKLMEGKSRTPISKETGSEIKKIICETLLERAAKLPSLGTVYIDPALKDIPVPSNSALRNINKDVVTLPFGSKIPLSLPEAEDLGEEVLEETLKIGATHENDRVVRAFTWWTNTQQEGYGARVDIDLSLMAIRKDGTRETVAYYDRSGPAVHSGDITDGGKYGGKGVCEFIDVNVDLCKKRGYKYLIFAANDYTGHKFSESPATFGWMEGRGKDLPGYGKHYARELFDARSVQMNMKLTGDSTRIIPAVFDIEKERMIWIDRSEKFVGDRPNNIGAMQQMINVSMERALDYEPLSMYDLAMIHAERRGNGFTSRLEEADTAFTMARIDREKYPQIKEVVTPYDLDKIKNLSSLEPEKKERVIDRADERADRSSEKKMDTKDILNAKRLLVHAGEFHSDDLMCAAMMKLVNPDITIERVTAVPEDIGKDTVVCDIGKGEFDHHQNDAKVDGNGHKYCAAELLYKKIKDALPIDDRENFEKILFCIGQNDNGEKRDTLSTVFSLYNTEWDRENDADRRFSRLTDLIVQRLTEEKDLSPTEIVPDHELENGFEDHLTGTAAMFLGNDAFSRKFIHSAEIEYADHARALQHAEEVTKEAHSKSDGHIVNLDTFAPYEALSRTTAEFVIFESNRGGYNLIAIPPEPGLFEQKIPIPNTVENMPGCTFCHPAHFIAVFGTKEQANAAAETIVKEHYKDVSKEQPEAGGDEQEI